MFSSSAAFCKNFLELLDNATKEIYPDTDIIWQNETVDSFHELSSHISDVCSNRKIVLLIDDADKNCNNHTFQDFLGVLRSNFLSRRIFDTFHSVIMASVKDIKNIELPDNRINYSPWNIAANFKVSMLFEPAEIETMLDDYEKEHRTVIDKAELAGTIYRYTCGYPFFVSLICKTIDERLDKNWTVAGIQEAVEIILSESNIIFDNLLELFENNPELSELMRKMVIKDRYISFCHYIDVVNLAITQGLIKNQGGRAVVSNRIFGRFLSKYFKGRVNTMKLCNAEIIKKVKDLEEQKRQILTQERNTCCSTYQKEADLIDLGYDFDATRKAVAEIDKEVVRLKHALNLANATVVVPEFDMTIGECIVYMAQLNLEKRTLEGMAEKSRKTRTTTYGGMVEFTITNYDIQHCKAKLQETSDIIRKLQIAVDRVNLTNEIKF
jgi:hypothetical protein